MFRWLAVAVLLVMVVGGGLFLGAGLGDAPSLSIDKPERAIGQQSELQVTAGAPGAKLTSLTIALEQNGKSFPLFALDTDRSAAPESAISRPDADHLRITRSVGKASIPELQPGPARITATATRRSLLLRTLSNTQSRDVQVRLEPPRLTVLSTHHFVNHGGSEMVVYRATPAEVVSGVRVGDMEYPGFPASGASPAKATDPAVRMAFFALLHDQELKTPINLFARDDGGNEVTAGFVDRVFPKPFKKSRIEVDDRFFGRVVPEILAHSPELNTTASPGDLLPAFLKINGDLRRMNSTRIVELTRKTSPSLLFKGAFIQLGNSQVEAGFADHRTYLYNGKEIDQQVHLGFDLAVTAHVPIVAANDGTVVNASWLGIYGNCVILDHGMGIATLYGHLSSTGVEVGDAVAKGQVLGRSGTTGLAGGDHLHFTMLVSGHPVSPVDWWDPHWIEDRMTRKLSDAALSPAATP